MAIERERRLLFCASVRTIPTGFWLSMPSPCAPYPNTGMMALAVNVYRYREGKEAGRATRRLFAFSILYLFALFATLLLEVVVRAAAPLLG